MNYESSRSVMLLTEQAISEKKDRALKALYSCIAIVPTMMSLSLILLSIFFVFISIKNGDEALLKSSLIHLPVVVFMSINFAILGAHLWKRGHHYLLDINKKINLSSVSVRFGILLFLDATCFFNVFFSSLLWEYLTVLFAFLYVNLGRLTIDPFIAIILGSCRLIGYPYEFPKNDVAKHALFLTGLSVIMLFPETNQVLIGVAKAQGTTPLVGSIAFAGALSGAVTIAFLQVLKTGEVNRKAVTALTALFILLSRSSIILTALASRPLRASIGLFLIGLFLHICINWDRLRKSPVGLIIKSLILKIKRKYRTTMRRWFPRRLSYEAINLFLIATFVYLLMWFTQSLDNFTSTVLSQYAFYIYVLLAMLAIYMLTKARIKNDDVILRTIIFVASLLMFYFVRLDLPVILVHGLFGAAVVSIYLPLVFRFYKR